MYRVNKLFSVGSNSLSGFSTQESWRGCLGWQEQVAVVISSSNMLQVESCACVRGKRAYTKLLCQQLRPQPAVDRNTCQVLALKSWKFLRIVNTLGLFSRHRVLGHVYTRRGYIIPNVSIASETRWSTPFTDIDRDRSKRF